MVKNDWVKGALIGGVVGVIIGILLAPKSGKENREDICKLLSELMEKAEHSYEDAIAELYKLIYDGSATYEDKKGRLKNAFDAALAAYKVEKATTANQTAETPAE